MRRQFFDIIKTLADFLLDITCFFPIGEPSCQLYSKNLLKYSRSSADAYASPKGSEEIRACYNDSSVFGCSICEEANKRCDES
jgi:hypothetical protein